MQRKILFEAPTMETSRELEKVISFIRSCIISTKDKLTLTQLNRDYKILIGERIPFRKFGFNKLEELIESCSDLALVRSGEEHIVIAKSSEKSVHISEMVSVQKHGKRRPNFKPFSRAAPPPRMQQTSQWRPRANYGGSNNNYNNSKKPQQSGKHSHCVKYASAMHSRAAFSQHSNYSSNDKGNNDKRSPTAVLTASAPAPKSMDMNHRLNTNRGKEQANNIVRENITDSNFTYRVSHNSSTHFSNNNISTSRPGVTLKAEPNRASDSSTNPLMSTRKRLNKKMSQLTLERDSGNSSPTNENPPPSPNKYPDFLKTESPITDLARFVELHKLGDLEENVTNVKNTKQSTFYSCKIKIGSHGSWSSYPKEYYTAQEAKLFCYKKALDELISRFQDRQRSLLISSQEDILERVPPLLEKHVMGLFANQLAMNYVEKFNEMLPDDWTTIIDASPCVRIEKVSGNNYVLHHCRPGEQQNWLNEVLQKRPRTASSMPSPTEVSVKPSTIHFGEDGKLFVEVTCAISANQIWCQQIGTKEREIYDEMLGRMQVYYQQHQDQVAADLILPDNCYVAKYEDSYCRVRTLKITDNQIDCFFIDFGDEMVVKETDIFKLKKEFATSEAQAFMCRLFGLEDLYDIAVNSQCLISLCEKTVVIELAEEISGNDISLALPVYMYDAQSGNCINEELISKLTIELATPVLDDGINEVYVSHVEPTGTISVHMKTRGYDNLQLLRQQLEEEITTKPPDALKVKVTQENSEGKMYFMKDKINEIWLRAKLIDWSPDGRMAQVLFVDEGHTDVITVENEVLYPLETLHDVLNKYPHQAITVKMALNFVPTNLVDLTKKMLLREEPVILKLVGSFEGVPLGKLFKRNAEGLFCINESLDMQSELNSKEETLKSKLRVAPSNSSMNVPSSGSLKCPPLPKIGDEFFEVRVSVAVNPFNFFVQPLESFSKLNEMMTKLQRLYKDVEYGDLKVDDILPGDVYASKYTDGCWYRTSVIKVINSGSVSVFYCDFGFYQTLSVRQLVTLDKEFLQLPYQALKAKLADIKPKQSKWTMDDCDEFKKLTEKKMFFAKLTSIDKDYLYESDILLKLILIDTSTDNDLIVGQELVEKGIAVAE
ncbi:tudor domain-containing protein 7A isoform X2 [Euwallacea fornicatus]|uniref:tudor domain-containing protein 7A isoform X2 n=1 Tax=Euwallacea fornicatus TaxID=995702 RepID=UPI00338EF5FD